MTEKDCIYNWMAFREMESDGKCLLENFQNYCDSTTMLSMTPLLCLYLVEAYKLQDMDNFVGDDIKDLRLKVKLFEGKYNKNISSILNMDKIQNEEYQSQLRFKFIGQLNLHYNLGVYFYQNNNLSSNSHIIGNTQFYSQYKNNGKYLHEQSPTEMLSLGEKIGKMLAQSILQIDPKYVLNTTLLVKNEPLYFYKDFNSNRSKFLFEFPKEIVLILIHILSNINFLLYKLHDIFENNANYTFRITYIFYYYCVKSLNMLVNHVEQNKHSHYNVEKILKLKCDTQFINSDVRSCMMHYEFINKNQYLIDDKCLDLDLTFYGLIETHFKGQDCKTVYSSIITTLKYLSKTIDELICLDKKNLKKL